MALIRFLFPFIFLWLTDKECAYANKNLIYLHFFLVKLSSSKYVTNWIIAFLNFCNFVYFIGKTSHPSIFTKVLSLGLIKKSSSHSRKVAHAYIADMADIDDDDCSTEGLLYNSIMYRYSQVGPAVVEVQKFQL